MKDLSGNFAATVSRSRLLIEWGRKPAERKKRDVLKGNYKHCPKQTAIEADTACPVSFLLSRLRKEWYGRTKPMVSPRPLLESVFLVLLPFCLFQSSARI